MQKLKLADICFEMRSDCEEFPLRFKEFYSSYDEYTDVSININGCSKILRPDGTSLLNEDINWIRSADSQEKLFIYKCKEQSDEIRFLMSVDKNWKQSEIYYLSDDIHKEIGVNLIMGEILFRNTILLNQGLVMHASSIKWRDKGIIFTAPSGTGKSTQANLWEKLMGAQILNGDRSAIRFRNGKAEIYGTPWSGSSPNYLNLVAPLSAIVVLEQAEENNIYTLSKQEAVSKLIPRCFLPYYDEKFMNTAINNLIDIIDRTRIYLLRCRPDEGAVQLVCECVEKNE